MVVAAAAMCHSTVFCQTAAAQKSDAKNLPDGVSQVRTVEAITEYKLDKNGLSILLLPDHSAPAATFMVTYRVGSRNESYGTTGATHLLEHLMFKGTYRYNKESKNGFDQLLERTGAITNATTWLDRTNYFETVPPQHLPLVVALEADRMRNLRLREDDRRPEMTVVRNEFERGENLPSEVLEKEIWASAYQAHPYHHSTIGWRSDVEKVPIEKLRAFYETFYWPDNATVSIIGDFEPRAALEAIKSQYGAIPKSPKPLPEVYTEEPPQTGPRRTVVKRPGELGIVMIAHKIPVGTHADFAALRVLSVILTDGRNSRMYEALTDKNLTTDVTANPSFNRDPTLHILTAELTPDAKHADVEARMLSEVALVGKTGVKPEEVQAAIAKITAETAFSRDGSFAMASQLNECIAVGDWTMYYKLDEGVRKVTPADVQRVAKAYFRESQRTTGWFIPESAKSADDAGAKGAAKPGDAPKSQSRASEPEADGTARPNKLRVMPAAAGQSLVQKDDAAEKASGDATKASGPAPAKIAPRIARSRTSGVDLLVCSTGTKDVVAIVGSLPAFDAARPVLTDLVAGMLERGTKKHNADEVAAMLDRVGATINFGAESGNIEFEARCLKKDVPLVVSLLAEQLRQPKFPADEFEKLRTQELADAEQSRQETDLQAAVAFSRAAFAPGHPYYRLSADETVAALKSAKLDDVKAFYGKAIGPANCTLVVVGDIEGTNIQGEVEKAFRGWTGGQPRPNVAVSKVLAVSVDLPVAIPGKQSVSVIIGQAGGVKYADPDHLALSVATSALGHGFTSRLIGTVRDTEGLTYGIGSALAGRGPYDRAWAIRATFAPSLLEKGLVSTRRELTKWYSGGITQEELEYRKSALAGEHQVHLATSRGLADTILDTVERGLEPSWIDEYPEKLSALTLDQVNATIRKRLNPKAMITVTAGSVKR
jgi:zinc protease